MNKHTRGPWETADGFGAVENGTCIKSVHDDHLVASCSGYYGREGAIANARLIAAAPELLDALENLLKVHKGEGGTKYHAGDIARAAIARARGES